MANDNLPIMMKATTSVWLVRGLLITRGSNGDINNANGVMVMRTINDGSNK
jgi:hypothetical protein